MNFQKSRDTFNFIKKRIIETKVGETMFDSDILENLNNCDKKNLFIFILNEHTSMLNHYHSEFGGMEYISNCIPNELISAFNSGKLSKIWSTSLFYHLDDEEILETLIENFANNNELRFNLSKHTLKKLHKTNRLNEVFSGTVVSNLIEQTTEEDINDHFVITLNTLGKTH